MTSELTADPLQTLTSDSVGKSGLPARGAEAQRACTRITTAQAGCANWWEGDVMADESQPTLHREEPQSSLCSCQSLTATSPVGASVWPLATSESVVLGTSSLSAISANVIPIGSARRSAMRDRQAVDLRF